jgi:DivIVA domain-containing protein
VTGSGPGQHGVVSTDLATRVASATFPTTRVREGYAVDEVDAFLARVAAALRAGEPVAQMVEEARFRPVAFKRGYDMGAVDALLDEVTRGSTHPADVRPATETRRTPLQLVRDARFRPASRGEHGYDMGQVDALLDALEAELVAGRPVGALVGRARLTRRRKGGYAEEQVDDLLAELIDQ